MEKDSKHTPKEPAHPVDKGWAWVIFIASIISFFLSSGLIRAFGVLFVEFKKKFNANTAEMSVVTGLENGVYSCFCLFVLTVGLRYMTSRQCVVAGGILSSLSFILSSRAENIFFLLFSYSVLYGISFALVIGPSILVLGKYFKRHAGLANGCIQASSSLGALVLAPLCRYLIDTYSLNGALLIISGILFHLVLAGVLMRPPELYEKWHRLKKKAEKRKAACRKALLDEEFQMEPFRARSPTCDSTFSPLARIAMLNVKRMNSKTGRSDSLDSESDFTAEILSKLENAADAHTSNKHEDVSSLHSNPSKYITIDRREENPVGAHCLYGSTELVYTLSCDDLHRGKNDRTRKRQTSSTSTVSNTSSQLYKSTEMNVGCKSCLKRFFNYSVLLNKPFILFAIAYMLGVIGSYLPTMYVPDLAEDFGIDKDRGALLVSIIMGADVIGRVGSGILADRNFLSRQNIISISLLFTAVLQHLVRYMTHFWSLVLFSCLYGLFGGVLFSLYPTVLVDILGSDDLRSGLCVLQIGQGISWGLSSPILGAIRDLTGNYFGTFHFFGTTSLLSSIILFANDRLFGDKKYSIANKEEDIT